MDHKYKMLEMKGIAETLNNRTYTDYFYRLMLISMSIFKWENLPNGIDEKWIEKYLFNMGRCMFYKDDTLGFMVTKCTTDGMLNFYDEPTSLRPVATNYSNTQSYVNGKECVMIRNNDFMIPTVPTIELFAYRLADISRTIDINIHAQKTPILIKCSDKQRLTLKNVYRQWNGNEPVIFGDKSLNMEQLEVLKTDAPIVFDKLQLQKHAIWNECMTFLGINNANQDKKERLVDDEVQANNEQVQMSGEMMLKARQRAADDINRLFGTNIKVSMRSDLFQEKVQKLENDIELGDEEVE